ncbi:MAG: PIG-L family deacetylase, partial [Chitinophagia bacterium]|nr:PIG-L family deacetylase [Chitinophagia bacterium]
MKKVVLCAALFCMAGNSFGQQVRPASSDKIYHKMARLRKLVNVLYIAAHPDDENTRLLAWLVNEKNINTAYLSLTRGDGGQNILGSEQGAALGLIRTHELMEARKIDGAQQYFTRAIDFGFSKSYDETFKHWDKNVLTGDAVWVIRKFRPDVIICRFPPNKDAGHGQHAASAIIAAEAYKASGDRNRYPDQLIYTEPWQAKRIFWNTYRFGDRNTTSEDQLKLKVGDYVPTLGMGTGELAGMSRSVHKSQGAGTPSVPGALTEYFKLVDGENVQNNLFDGIDITWGRVGRNDIGADIKAMADAYDFRHPEASVPALLDIRKKINTVTDDFWRRQKLAEVDELILDCSGLMLELYTKRMEAVAGETLPFTLQIISRADTAVRLKRIFWTANDDTTVGAWLSNDSLYKMEHTLTVPAATPQTEPYWLAEAPTSAGQFSIPNKELLGYPETPNQLNAIVEVQIGRHTFKIPVPLSSKRLDPVKGDVVEPLRIVPAVTLGFNGNLIIAGADGHAEATVHLRALKEIKAGRLLIGGGMNSFAVVPNIHLRTNVDTQITVKLNVASLFNTNAADKYVNATFAADEGGAWAEQQNIIRYDHAFVRQGQLNIVMEQRFV